MSQPKAPEAAVLSRRDMLRRSAVLGGALAVTAPAVQSFARPAFASSPEGLSFSNIFVAFYECPGSAEDTATVVGAINSGNGWTGAAGPSSGMGCNGTTAAGGAATNTTVLSGPTAGPGNADFDGTWTVTVPACWQIAFGYISQPGGECASGAISVDGRQVTFYLKRGVCGSGNNPCAVPPPNDSTTSNLPNGSCDEVCFESDSTNELLHEPEQPPKPEPLSDGTEPLGREQFDESGPVSEGATVDGDSAEFSDAGVEPEEEPVTE